jgi:predicted N-acetyltransferase YhbS
MVRRTERDGLPDLVGMQALVQRIWSSARELAERPSAQARELAERPSAQARELAERPSAPARDLAENPATQLAENPSALPCRWHVGDVAWAACSVEGASDGWRSAVWTDGGHTVAWGWADGDHLDLVVDPARSELAGQVLDWFHERATGKLACTVLETEEHLRRALAVHSYTVDSDGRYFRHHRRDLADLEPAVVPEGFRLRSVRPGEAAARSAAHRAAWSDVGPSRVTARSYAEVMDTWPYRFELDWVVEADDGELVASALGWLDQRAGVGLLEPAGSAPSVRRRGLGRAVSLAVLHAMRKAGATAAVVCPRGDDAYPIPGQLYRGLGFRPGARTVTYRRIGL